MEFIKGEVSCTGLMFEFKSNVFRSISVQVMIDPLNSDSVFNYVLAIPEYTERDRFGRKSISQQSRKVKKKSDLNRYFRDLKKRFDCPVI